MTIELNSPLALPCGATLKNRLFKSAMTEGLAGPDGHANERHNNLYRQWAEGGAGMLLSGNVMIDRRYLERPGNVVVDGNGGEQALRDLARTVTERNCHLWMQVSHPGRQCSRIVTAHPMAPSPVQLNMLWYFGRPRAMVEDDIHNAIAGYARVARTARETGFTGVQIHAAHGYLISQFLSPVVNKREDDWGGPLENRARLLLETVKAVREAVGNDFPLAVKLNSADFQKGGFSLDESMVVAGWLSDAGIDFLEISGGTYEQARLLGRTGKESEIDEPQRESTKKREAYFVDYAKRIRGSVSCPLGVTGGFRSREAMVNALANNELDAIGLARPMCTEPDVPQRLIDGSAESCRRDEHDLRLGSGVFGPNTTNPVFKALNTQGAVAWFYRQIIELAENRPIRNDLGMARALIEHFRDETRIGLARRRWLKKNG